MCQTSATVSRCIHDHLKNARVALVEWHLATWCQDWLQCSFTVVTILSDFVLMTLASNRILATLESLWHTLGLSWAMLEQYTSEVARIAVHEVKHQITEASCLEHEKQQCKNKEQVHIERECTWAEKENIPGVLL
ncbi:hypothetical protein F5I97DRAFT_1798991 [Phlebopus sp. FC_14]|nr:hypothetical protein F5I97DRAFT_1798991 [Phlebopus sp. FC_14]